MIKKLYLLFGAFLAMTTIGSQAQTLIDEGFENLPGTQTTATLPDGWERVGDYTGSNLSYRWSIGYSSSGTTMSGHRYAYADAPTWEDPNAKDAYGPREDILYTPAVMLDDTYQLAFDWEAAAYGVLSQGLYTLQVGIYDVATGQTEVIFDITNEEQVRNSGVPADIYGTYLWTNWAVNTSKIDLSPWQGKEIKVAFIYKMLKKTGNIVYLDNVSIKQHTPETGPIAQLTQTNYQFPATYIGEKLYSEVLTLKNVGLRGLKVTGFEAPECIGLSMDTAGMSLGVNETARFQIYYLSTFTSPTEADVVLKTNGGDVTLHVSATKMAVPDGYTLELFEGQQFPPAGWVQSNTTNKFSASPYALEGDYSLYTAGFIEDNYITLPRLDLSDPETPAVFMFTYYSQFDPEESIVPGNDLILQVSTNGSPFTQVWKADPYKVDTIMTINVDLSAYRCDSVVLRLLNTACYYDSEYGMDDDARFFIDRVLLPGLYGADGVPTVAELVEPAQDATDIYVRNITFRWNEAQFAEGYRLYVGTSPEHFDVVDGLDVQQALTYVLPHAEYATTYFWKVVPYNAVGDAQDVPVWSFTTQDDMTVREFPWQEGFESGLFAPLGWLAENTRYSKWSASDYYPMDGKYSAMAYSNETEVETILTTPDIQLPDGDAGYQLSFWWGNDRPVNLTKDNTQVRLNHSTQDDGIDAVMFDIQVDGGDWQQIKLISNNQEGVDEDDEPIRYWVYESLDLSPYAGKTVAFRWRYISHNYSRSRGASLDNVRIQGNGANVSFSADAWDAFKVNYGKQETSPEMGLTNLGAQAVTVSEVKFVDTDFSTTLKAGDVIEPSASKVFTVSYRAKSVPAGDEYKAVDDEMVVTLSDGTTVSLGVSAIALAPDMQYFGFERDNTGVGPEGFRVIDVDGRATSRLTFWDFPNNGSPLAFFVLNDAQCYNSLKEPHGHQSLMTRCNTDGAFHDWIVSAPMVATDQSRFEFDMRNWESINSILPADCPTVSVLVSTTSATDRNSFTQVGDSFKPELYNDVSWDHLSYDLSAYAGQRIFIALKSEASNCLGAFYDNFEFAHFASSFDVNQDGLVDVTDVNIVIDMVLGKQEGWATDFNGDGQTDVTDVNMIIDNILGK